MTLSGGRCTSGQSEFYNACRGRGVFIWSVEF